MAYLLDCLILVPSWQWFQGYLDRSWWTETTVFVLLTTGAVGMSAVWRARESLSAYFERKFDSAVPDWIIIMYGDPKHLSPSDAPYTTLRIDLVNAGFGAAQEIELSFDSHNGNNPTMLFLGNPYRINKLAGPGDSMPIFIRWNFAEPLDGRLTVSCKNLNDDPLSQSFLIEAFLDKQNLPVYNVGEE